MSLQQWLTTTIRNGEFTRRRPMRTWDMPTFNVKLWNFMAMGIAPATSKGYVWWSRSVEAFRPGPRRPRVIRAAVRWQAIRLLPETAAELRQWGFMGTHFMESFHIGNGRQYNATLRARLMLGLSPNQAHRVALRDIDAQATRLLRQQITLLVASTAAAIAPSSPESSAASGLGSANDVYHDVQQRLRR